MNRWPKIAVWSVCLFGLLMGVGKLSGLHLNMTASYPLGVWIETGPYQMGRTDRPYVLACAPQKPLKSTFVERGYLSWGIDCEGTAALLKRVWGRAGDAWTVSKEGVYINDTLVPNTQPLTADSAGRAMPTPKVGTIPTGYVLLLSEYHPSSLDGRYFGTTPITDLIAEVTPLWTESY